jgi:hypothetical protein
MVKTPVLREAHRLSAWTQVTPEVTALRKNNPIPSLWPNSTRGVKPIPWSLRGNDIHRVAARFRVRCYVSYGRYLVSFLAAVESSRMEGFLTYHTSSD